MFHCGSYTMQCNLCYISVNIVFFSAAYEKRQKFQDFRWQRMNDSLSLWLRRADKIVIGGEKWDGSPGR